MRAKSHMTALWCFLLIGVVAIGSFVWINLSPSVARVDPGNPTVLSGPRAKILDRDGVVLVSGQGKNRTNLFDELFQPVIGIASPGIGVAGIESRFSDRLVNTGQARLSYFGRNPEPEPLRTTLSLTVQRAADRALGPRRGAVVVLDATGGEVWAQVSHPNYSPKMLKKNWKTLKESPDSPLFDRASSASRYPPGSVMKIADALLLLKKSTAPFHCPGSVVVNGSVIRCPHPHGHVSGLADGFARSCNSMFIQRTLAETSPEEFYRSARKLGFVIPDSVENGGENKWALAVIGQGGVSLAPVQAARIAAAVVNDGMMPEPLYVKEKGKHERVMEPGEANLLRQLMEGVVKVGTGRGLFDLTRQGARLGLKTGTAQVERKKGYVDWAVGFYTPPAQTRMFAFAVVVEDADGYASEVCLPIVRQIVYALRARVEKRDMATSTWNTRDRGKPKS